MASIKDALEESLQDNNAIIKYILYTIPAYFCIMGYNNSNQQALLLPVYIFLFGFLLKCTQNVKHENNTVLPSFNIFATFWAGLKGFIALAPIAILAGALAYYLTQLSAGIFTDEKSAKFIFCIIVAISGSIFYTGYILYAQNFKVKDAYNFKLISKYFGDILVGFLIMLLKLGIANAIICLPASYLMLLFIGISSPVAIFIWCMISVINLAVIGHYTAQMDSETIAVKENKDNII